MNDSKTPEKASLVNPVDHTWNCTCGALNGAYRDTCGHCAIHNIEIISEKL